MKIVWSPKSISEFEALDRAAAKEAWIKMYSKVRSNGDCKLAPIVAIGVSVLVMLSVIVLVNLWVVWRASGRIYTDVQQVPKRKVAVLLGTSARTANGFVTTTPRAPPNI